MTFPPGAGATAAPATVSAAGALRGSLQLPADKSVAHRALLFDAMGSGPATVSLHRPGGDVLSMIGALDAIGAVESVESDPDGAVRVTIRGGGDDDAAQLLGAGGESLDCGNAGTAMRLLAGALAGRPRRATLTGDASLSGRPMERVAAPLRAMGATVTTTDGHAPMYVAGARPLLALHHELAVASAQVVGCISLAALAADGQTTILVPGPTRDHTERMLAWLHAPVRREGPLTTIDGPAGYAARSMNVPGDISSAAAWLVAGALHPDADITLEGVGLNPSRTGVLDVLREMGADIEVTLDAAPGEAGPEPIGSIRVRGGRPLEAIHIEGARVADVIDELPLIAMAMAAADGVSELSGASELRVKESDRIALVTANLAAIGAVVEERPDGWRVSRGHPRDAEIHTDGDHRVAMSFAIAALAGVAGSVTIDDPECAAVSYPTFWADMGRLAE